LFKLLLLLLLLFVIDVVVVSDTAAAAVASQDLSLSFSLLLIVMVDNSPFDLSFKGRLALANAGCRSNTLVVSSTAVRLSSSSSNGSGAAGKNIDNKSAATTAGSSSSSSSSSNSGGGYKGFGSFHSDNVQEMMANPSGLLIRPAPLNLSHIDLRLPSPGSKEMKERFFLDPSWTFINHGEFFFPRLMTCRK
jgi:hypothetical protein